MPADWDIPMAKIVETEAEMDEASRVRSIYRKELLKQARRVKRLEKAVAEMSKAQQGGKMGE